MKRCGIGVLLAVCTASCDSGSSGGGGGGATVAGAAIKGPLANATVHINGLRSTGTLTPPIGTGTSDADGNFEVAVSGSPGLCVAQVFDGTFVDEATGSSLTIPDDLPLFGFVDATDGAPARVVTPVTTIAFALQQYFAHDPEARLEDSVENALASAEDFFGLSDIDLVPPADLTAGPVSAGPAADHGIVIAGLSQLADTAGVHPMALVTALASDAGDGRLDGLFFGTPVPLEASTLSPTAGTSELAAAIAGFLAGPRNASGLTGADTEVDNRLAASTGAFASPIEVRALVDGYGLVNATVAAHIEARLLPLSPQVLVETQVLQVTSLSAIELGFDIPAGLPLGLHDLVVLDADTGLVTRLRDAIEVFDGSAPPTLSATAPPAGPLTGGTFLRLTGTSFGPDTEVEIDGVPAVVMAHDFPRSLVVVSPPHAAGSVDVTVRNGLADAVRADAFEYRSGDTRVNPDLPSPTTPIVFGAFRHFVDDAEGLTAQALVGRSTFSALESGSFTLDSFKSTTLVPEIVMRDRQGTTFRANESLGSALLLSDSTNGINDFLRGFTNEENGVSLGATAFGPAVFFPEPVEAQVGSIAREYWANGIEVNVGQRTLRQKTGWIELDDELQGSASFLEHGRDHDGTTVTMGFEKWLVDYTFTEAGEIALSRQIGNQPSQVLRGRFSAGGELGFLVLDGADETLGWYLLTPVQHGSESAAFGGWVGGSLQHELVDDGAGGLETAFETGTVRGLVTGTEEAGELAFRRASRHSESDPASSFREDVGAVRLDVSPSGRIFEENGDLVGYVDDEDGIRLFLGRFPDEQTLAGGLDLPIGTGGAVFRDSRKSFLSLEPQQKQVAVEAKFLELGTTHRQELGTDLFDVTLDPDTHPVVDGVAIPLAGTVPVLAADALAGLHKSTVRDETGAAETTRDDPQAWGVSAGYSCVDDTLDLFATEVTEPTGRFGGAAMPRWVASGTLSNDGETATLRTSDEFLGDGLVFWIADRDAVLEDSVFEVDSVGLAFLPNEGGPSLVSSTLGRLGFLGNGQLAVELGVRSKGEDGVFTPFDTSSGTGVVGVPVGQQMRLNIPNGLQPDREWEVVWTPSGDSFVGIDDSPTLDRAEIVIGMRPPEAIASFVDDDRVLIGLELDPQLSRATTEQLFLAPRTGTLLTGELFTSRRDAGYALLPGQSFAATTTTDLGVGVARVTFVNQVPVLRFLFNDRDEAAGQQELLLDVTPRIVHSLEQ